MKKKSHMKPRYMMKVCEKNRVQDYRVKSVWKVHVQTWTRTGTQMPRKTYNIPM